MKATITSIELKGPLKFFILSSNAYKILKQLKTTECKQVKTIGFWTKHYTMTLWNSEDELKAFAHSGAHKEAMKLSSKMAKKIATYTYDTETLPNWQEGKALLAKHGKLIKF